MLVEECDLLFGISKGVRGNGEKFGMLANTFYIFGSRFFTVADTHLNKISRVFGLFIIIKFHEKNLHILVL